MENEGPSAPPGDEPGRAAKEGPFGEGQGLPRRFRLQRRREFLRVQRSGAKHHTRFFLVFVAPSTLRGRTPSSAAARAGSVASPGLPATRLGVTVTRKVGKAVKRNWIKRLVREAFRREHHALPAGLDMVWVAKRDAIDTSFEAVIHDMQALAGRLHAPRGRAGAASPSSARSR
jgi:ribonuclease P protein component